MRHLCDRQESQRTGPQAILGRDRVHVRFGDPKCLKIKAELKKRLSELFVAHQQRNRDFDRVEMGDGGNIHQLILRLVNGD